MSRLVSTDYGGWIALAAGSCRGVSVRRQRPPILSVSLFCLEANAMNRSNLYEEDREEQRAEVVVCKGFGEPLRPTCTSLYMYSICQQLPSVVDSCGRPSRHRGSALLIDCQARFRPSGHQALASSLSREPWGCPCCPAARWLCQLLGSICWPY